MGGARIKPKAVAMRAAQAHGGPNGAANPYAASMAAAGGLALLPPAEIEQLYNGMLRKLWSAREVCRGAMDALRAMLPILPKWLDVVDKVRRAAACAPGAARGERRAGQRRLASLVSACPRRPCLTGMAASRTQPPDSTGLTGLTGLDRTDWTDRTGPDWTGLAHPPGRLS
jgi:hypothetical protein